MPAVPEDLDAVPDGTKDAFLFDVAQLIHGQGRETSHLKLATIGSCRATGGAENLTSSRIPPHPTLPRKGGA